MNPIVEDILDVVLGVDPKYRRRNRQDYTNPNVRPRMEPGETGGYLWDKHAGAWSYDPEASAADLRRYRPGGY